MKKLYCFLAISLIITAIVFLCFTQNKMLEVPQGNIMLFNEAASYAEKLINVPAICQYPQLPTGCEATAATMVLQYYGEDITIEEFAASWLECSDDFYMSNDELYGPDPNESFVGSPFSLSAYGCFASTIVKAVNNNSKICKAEKITNMSVDELCGNYIDNGRPILIWATTGMKESVSGTAWYLWDDSEFVWPAGEHCLVLVGYTDNYYFLNDPQSGSTVAYQKDIVEKRFNELGNQAVCIYC